MDIIEDLVKREIKLLKDKLEDMNEKYEIEFKNRSRERFSSITQRNKWTITNKRLYELFVQHKLSPHKVSFLLNVSKRTVERWLYEDSIPDYESRLKLIILLGEDVC